MVVVAAPPGPGRPGRRADRARHPGRDQRRPVRPRRSGPRPPPAPADQRRDRSRPHAPSHCSAQCLAKAQGRAPASLALLAVGVDEAGILDLREHGHAGIAACSTVNFSLRTPGEQNALVAGFGRFLNSLSGPVQILIRTRRIDLSTLVADLEHAAGGLEHPALEAAARDHAAFLAEISARQQLLGRQVLLIAREPSAGGASEAGARISRRHADAGAVLGGAQVQVSAFTPAGTAHCWPTRSPTPTPMLSDPPIWSFRVKLTCPAARIAGRSARISPWSRPPTRSRSPPGTWWSATSTPRPSRYRLPGRGPRRMARTAADLPRAPGHRPAHRPDHPLDRRRRTAAPARPAGVRPPARRRTRRLSTRRSRPPPQTPPTWPTASPAAKASSSASACTSPCTRPASSRWPARSRPSAPSPSSLLVTTAPTTFRQLRGGSAPCRSASTRSDPPHLRHRRAVGCVPVHLPGPAPVRPDDIDAPPGCSTALTPPPSGLVLWDRFGQDNHNSIILAAPGAGKSYFVKLEPAALRYTPGCRSIRHRPRRRVRPPGRGRSAAPALARRDGVRAQPLRPPRHAATAARGAAGRPDARGLVPAHLPPVLFGADAVRRRAGRARHRDAAPTPGAASPTDAAHLDAPGPAPGATCRRSSPDGSTGGGARPTAHPFMAGSFAGLFNGPTSTPQPPGTSRVLPARSARRAAHGRHPARARTPSGAACPTPPARRTPAGRGRRGVAADARARRRAFLFRMAKAARKYWAGLTVVTQDAADVLGSRSGRGDRGNSATQVLLRQAPQAIDAIIRAFRPLRGRAPSCSVGRPRPWSAGRRVRAGLLPGLASDAEHLSRHPRPADLVEDEDDGYFADPPGPGTAAVSGQEDLSTYSMIDDPDGDLL